MKILSNLWLVLTISWGVEQAMNRENNDLYSLRMLLTLEAIWFLKNQLLYNEGHVDNDVYQSPSLEVSAVCVG